MTKEEIVAQKFPGIMSNVFDGNAMFEAMDEYAKQQAIGFYKWVKDESLSFYPEDIEHFYEIYFNQPLNELTNE